MPLYRGVRYINVRKIYVSLCIYLLRCTRSFAKFMFIGLPFTTNLKSGGSSRSLHSYSRFSYKFKDIHKKKNWKCISCFYRIDCMRCRFIFAIKKCRESYITALILHHCIKFIFLVLFYIVNYEYNILLITKSHSYHALMHGVYSYT